jgi:hypothetical protein
MTVPAPDVRQRAAQVPGPLASLIASMLEKDRDARPASMAVVVDALRAASTHEPVRDRVATAALERRRGSWPAAATAAVVVVVVVVAMTSWLRPASAPPIEPESTTAAVTPAVAEPVPTPPSVPAPTPEPAAAMPTPTPTPPESSPSKPAATTTKPPRVRAPATPAAKARPTSKSAVVDPFAEDS